MAMGMRRARHRWLKRRKAISCRENTRPSIMIYFQRNSNRINSKISEDRKNEFDLLKAIFKEFINLNKISKNTKYNRLFFFYFQNEHIISKMF